MKSIIDYFVIAVLGFIGVANMSNVAEKALTKIRTLSLSKASNELVSMERIAKSLTSRN